MIKIVKRMIPKSIKYHLKKSIRQLSQVYYNFGEYNVECNICQWKARKFDSDNWHPHTVCPNCHSQVRHRLFWAIINHIDAFSIEKIFSNKRVLHFAPEEDLKNKLLKYCAAYKTADRLAEGYSYAHIDYNVDITDMSMIDNEAFDCILAFDVLEHVPKHLKAMEELYRILRNDGYCILTVPQKDHLVNTYEDPSITDPQEREQVFGQRDHLRIYGEDIVNMLESKGFLVTPLDEHCLSPFLVKRHVLFPPELSKHPLATNYRKIFFAQKCKG